MCIKPILNTKTTPKNIFKIKNVFEYIIRNTVHVYISASSKYLPVNNLYTKSTWEP